MDVLRMVECKVRRGLGPQWDEKTIEVYLDDIDPLLDDLFIRDMVISYAKHQLKQLGYSENAYIIKEIHSA